MEINRGRIEKLTDSQLFALWSETSRKEYAGVLLLRYMPFLYGAGVKHTESPEEAKRSMAEFDAGFTSYLKSYCDGTDFGAWLYDRYLNFLGEKHESEILSGGQKRLLNELIAENEGAWALFEQSTDKLSKPQRVCIESFCREHRSFERISGDTGYLTDKIPDYIREGIAVVIPSEDGGYSEVQPNRVSQTESYLRYTRGVRDDSSAFALEATALGDRFICDSLEGVSMHAGDHSRNIAELDNQLESKYFGSHRDRRWVWIVLIALVIVAAVLLVLKYCTSDKDSMEAAVKTEDVAESVERVGMDDWQGTGETIQPETQPEAMEIENTSIPHAEPESKVGIENIPGPQSEPVNSIVETAVGTQTGVVSLVSISKYRVEGKEVYVSSPKIGLKRFNDYLARAAVDLDESVEGDVTLTFSVNRYGRPSGIRVTEYLTQDAHREAIRLLDNGPEWSDTDREVTVVMHFR